MKKFKQIWRIKKQREILFCIMAMKISMKISMKILMKISLKILFYRKKKKRRTYLCLNILFIYIYVIADQHIITHRKMQNRIDFCLVCLKLVTVSILDLNLAELE
jgi:hypothetical protein